MMPEYQQKQPAGNSLLTPASNLEPGHWNFFGSCSLVLGCFFYTPSKYTRTYADEGVFIRIPLSNTFNPSHFEIFHSTASQTPGKRERL
jgi:hypothetical protein